MSCRAAQDCALLAQVLQAPPAGAAAGDNSASSGGGGGSSYSQQFAGPWELAEANSVAAGRQQQQTAGVAGSAKAVAPEVRGMEGGAQQQGNATATASANGTAAASIGSSAVSNGTVNVTSTGRGSGQRAPANLTSTITSGSACPTPSTPSNNNSAPLLTVGYLAGCGRDVLAQLNATPGVSLTGPLQPFPLPGLLADVLTVLLQSEAAWTLGSLYDVGLVDSNSHWYDVVLAGSAVPAVQYIKAQRVRRALLLAVQAYYRRYKLDVLLLPAQLAGPPSVRAGNDLATLLGLPQLMLPVGFNSNATGDAASMLGDLSIASIASASSSGGSSPRPEQADGTIPSVLEASRVGDDDGSTARRSSGGPSAARVPVGLLPASHSLLGLPGEDGKVLAAGVLLQAGTCCHLVRPPVAEEAAAAGPGEASKG